MMCLLTIPSSIKVSLTMITFISFWILFVIYLLKPKRTKLLLEAGICYLLLDGVVVAYAYRTIKNFDYIYSIVNIVLNIFIVKDFLNLFNKKIRKEIFVFSLLILIMSTMSLVQIIPVNYYFILYYAFLSVVNLYVSYEISKTKEKFMMSRLPLSGTFLFIALLNMAGCIFRNNSIYKLIYIVILSILVMCCFVYMFLLFHKYNEALLYEKEVCFDDTFNNSGTGMALANMEGIFIRINKSFCEMVGYTGGELMGKTTEYITHPDDYEEDMKAYKELIENKKSYFQREKRYIHKDGHVIWGILNISLIRNKEGKSMYFVAEIQNVTNYKILQNELEKSKQKYEMLLNSYNNPISAIDKNYRYVVVNRYVVDRINSIREEKLSAKEILGQKIVDIYPGIEKTELFRVYESVMHTRKQDKLVVEFRDINGELEWYEYRVLPSVEGILVFSINVTENIKNQQKIAENELKYRSLVEQSSDGIMLIDNEGFIIEFNKEVEKMTGYARNEIVGKKVWEVYNLLHHISVSEVDSDFKEMLKKQVSNKAASCKKELGTFQMRNRDGEEIYVQHFMYYISTSKNKMLCYVCRDVTETKKLEKIRESAAQNEKLLNETIEMERLRTEFFANLSHELRTPLNVIAMSNKMIYDSICDSTCQKKDIILKYLQATKLNSYRLQRLINNILDLSKIDSGYLGVHKQCCNIIETVEELAGLAVPYAERKNINIVFDTDSEEKLIMCDIGMIERAVLNLLSNAIKFSEGGAIKINLKDLGEKVEIVVCDNGIGIPEDRLLQIFDGFRQIDKSLTRMQEGAGIGLSIVKSIVEMHNGSINVESRIGEGTCVKIMLPTGDINDLDEIAVTSEMLEDKSEKVCIEFSDIYF